MTVLTFVQMLAPSLARQYLAGVLGVGGVKNGDGVAVGYTHYFALQGGCIQVACYD